jgi:hypothetical protein
MIEVFPEPAGPTSRKPRLCRNPRLQNSSLASQKRWASFRGKDGNACPSQGQSGLKKEKDQIALGEFVKHISDALDARTHLLREWALHWVLAPLLYLLTLSCLGLLVSDASGWIHPMRGGLLSIIRIVLGGEAISGSIGAGFGWLFSRRSKTKNREH